MRLKETSVCVCVRVCVMYRVVIILFYSRMSKQQSASPYKAIAGYIGHVLTNTMAY